MFLNFLFVRGSTSTFVPKASHLKNFYLSYLQKIKIPRRKVLVEACNLSFYKILQELMIIRKIKIGNVYNAIQLDENSEFSILCKIGKPPKKLNPPLHNRQSQFLQYQLIPKIETSSWRKKNSRGGGPRQWGWLTHLLHTWWSLQPPQGLI